MCIRDSLDIEGEEALSVNTAIGDDLDLLALDVQHDDIDAGVVSGLGQLTGDLGILLDEQFAGQRDVYKRQSFSRS